MPTGVQTETDDGRGSLGPGSALYLVATPIGNLEDITLRALRVLKEVDLIACEDTRQTQKLLSHYGIQTRTVSYHEHNEMTKAAELVVDLESGESYLRVCGSLRGRRCFMKRRIECWRHWRMWSRFWAATGTWWSRAR